MKCSPGGTLVSGVAFLLICYIMLKVFQVVISHLFTTLLVVIFLAVLFSWLIRRNIRESRQTESKPEIEIRDL